MLRQGVEGSENWLFQLGTLSRVRSTRRIGRVEVDVMMWAGGFPKDWSGLVKVISEGVEEGQ